MMKYNYPKGSKSIPGKVMCVCFHSYGRMKLNSALNTSNVIMLSSIIIVVMVLNVRIYCFVTVSASLKQLHYGAEMNRLIIFCQKSAGTAIFSPKDRFW